MIEAVIFDLDGVIVSTDEYHYLGWQRLADEEGIDFDRNVNERLRGVSRMESLEILLEKSTREYSDSEKLEMTDRKNGYYKDSLQQLNSDHILPGVMSILNECKEKGIKIAIGSSSRNSPFILEQIGLGDFFDATVDGNDISRSKPDPEVFVKAAQCLGVPPEQCLVVEDAEAGVEAGVEGGMKVLAVGSAADDSRADLSAKNMAAISLEEMMLV